MQGSAGKKRVKTDLRSAYARIVTFDFYAMWAVWSWRGLELKLHLSW